MSTDVEWERWATRDPYFAVITDPKYRGVGIADERKAEFFESGRLHIEQTLATCRRRLDADFQPRRALDFGCGVGRLVIPLAAIAEEVVGVDVSPTMLQEAARNCSSRSIDNARLVVSDDGLTALDGMFDFIHSFIVFQHIPPERGRAIFGKLLGHLAPGGVACLQITYAKGRFDDAYGAAPALDLRQKLRAALKRTKNYLRRTPLGRLLRAKQKDPEMQMNAYSLNELLFMLQRRGVKRMHVEFTDHGGDWGAFLHFQRPRRA